LRGGHDRDPGIDRTAPAMNEAMMPRGLSETIQETFP
jgi:hypothetical protein